MKFGKGNHGTGDNVERGKEPDCSGSVPDIPSGRLSRGTFQVPEHGSQFLHYEGGAGNGAGAGRPGAGSRG